LALVGDLYRRDDRVMTTITRFDFRYDRWCGWLLGLLGSGRRFSHIDVVDAEPDGSEVRVQLGFAFRSSIPRKSIRSARRWRGPVWGWGAHGWRGRWLVNGSSRGIVILEVEPAASAKVLGIPVRVTQLALSVEEPDRFCEHLGLQLAPVR
jgi:hypothetical protein